MKKYTLVLFVFFLSFILLGFNVNSASAANCASGELFSTVTGQPCGTTIPVDCKAGDLFSSLTGKPCTGANLTDLQTKVAVLLDNLFNRELSQGTTGEDVKALQQILKDAGFLSGSVDSSFGSITEAALIKYQNYHNLTATGKLDASTLQTIKATPALITCYSLHELSGFTSTCPVYLATTEAANTTPTTPTTPISSSTPLRWSTPFSLPDATVGTYYSTNIYTTGGSCPFTLTMQTTKYSADCLFPPGLSLNGIYNSKYATISGTPIMAGIYNAICINASSCPSMNGKFNLVIKAANASNLSITNTWLESGNIGGNYHTTLSATGGSETYVWSAEGLPLGYYINPSTGLISGSPDKGGNYTPKITVTSGTQSDSRQFTLVIYTTYKASQERNVTACVNSICSGTNSKLTEVSNGAGRSSISEGWSPVCCDSSWWIDTRGSNWDSVCNGKTGLQSGGWYKCN